MPVIPEDQNDSLDISENQISNQAAQDEDEQIWSGSVQGEDEDDEEDIPQPKLIFKSVSTIKKGSKGISKPDASNGGKKKPA
jgi:hypothetical protein